MLEWEAVFMVGHGRISLAAVICGIAFLLSGAIGEAGFIPSSTASN